jgi:hypothetical protein
VREPELRLGLRSDRMTPVFFSDPVISGCYHRINAET